MSTYRAANRYMSDSVTTADPARLLVMLYDRLLLDLDRAATALQDGESAHQHLLHAQDIVTELLSSLRVEVWDGGASLSALYSFILNELIGANVGRDARRVADVRRLVLPLRDAWFEAALATSIDVAHAS